MIDDFAKTTENIWHAAIVRSTNYQRTAERLAALESVDETYAPLRLSVTVKRGRRIERWVPWLGTIVLARWDGDDAAAWHHINDTSGVMAILGGEFPASIRGDEVERMRRWLEGLGERREYQVKAPCKTGDTIQFDYLAFQEWKSRVLEVCDECVLVMVTLLGVDTELYVPFQAITAVESRNDDEWRGNASQGRKRPRRRSRARGQRWFAAADQVAAQSVHDEIPGISP
jgi:transcription antitermination factor NusG